MPTIHISHPSTADTPNAPVFCAVAQALQANDLADMMVFLVMLDAQQVSDLLQDVELVGQLTRHRPHIESMQVQADALLYDYEQVSELFDEYSPDEAVAELAYDWEEIPVALGQMMMKRLEVASAYANAVISPAGVEYRAAERYSGFEYFSFELSAAMLGRQVGRILTPDELPKEAQALLQVWAVLRGACRSAVELPENAVRQMSDGAVRIEADIPCQAADYPHLEQMVQKLAQEHPDWNLGLNPHTQQPNSRGSVHAAIAVGQHYHTLTINVPDTTPAAKTVEGAVEDARRALAGLPVPVTGSVADGAAQALARLPEDAAAKLLGVAVLQAQQPPASGHDAR